jgi:hypothetical protein
MSESGALFEINELDECDLEDGGPWYQDFLQRADVIDKNTAISIMTNW